MGQCFSSASSDSNSINPRTPGTTTTNSITNTSSSTSASGSSLAGKSQFSQAVSASDDIDHVNDQNRDGRFLDTPNLKEYTFADLKTATKNFSSVLGEGGFGRVYKGWVDDKTLAPSKSSGLGMIVAIKKLNHESFQGFKEWQSEVDFLGRLSHPNLVKLLGYCWEDKELLLVYEFMQKRSLDSHLFRRNLESLSWNLRLKIAIGAARGLAFLHTSDKHVIYRDFKASNILLDGNYNAKISDFGLAKLGPNCGESHVTTRIIGTYGYAAPEYIATGHLYVKSDVYGFGVVLLEMLSGLRAHDTSRPIEKQNLVDWAKPLLCHKSRVKHIMDVRMKGQYSSKAAYDAAQLALKCLEQDPKNRPAMKQVLEVLEKIESMKGNSKSSTSSSVQRKQMIAPRSPRGHV
ncbi:hypothetical protein ACFE04_013508 [Oxalis oulophora]